MTTILHTIPGLLAAFPPMAACMINGLAAALLLVVPSAPPGDEDVAAGAAVPSLEVLVGGRSRSRALVVALHGGSWTGRPHRERAEEMLAALDDEARRAGLRLVVPVLPPGAEDAPRRARNGPSSGVSPPPDAPGPPSPGRLDDPTVPWARPAQDAALVALVAREVAENRVDPRRVSLAGHGAGGTAALLLAARHPDLLAGVALWSASPSPVVDEHGEVVGLVEGPADALRETAVYLWTGTDDRWIHRDAVTAFVEAMRTAREREGGHELVWSRGEGGHGYGHAGPREGLHFLKRQRRRERPRRRRRPNLSAS